MFDPKTILIYTGQELIGDGLIKLPYVRAVRQAYPNAKITWLAGQGKTVYASTLRPLVSGLLDHVLEDYHVGESPWEIFQKPKLSGTYDLIIDTQKRASISLILKRLPHKVFLSHSLKGLLSSKTSVWFQKPPRHDLKRLFSLSAHGGRSLTLSFSSPSIPPTHEAIISHLLPKGRVYVGLAPGAGNRVKCWPPHSYIRLARAQLKKGRTPVFILGPEEKDMRPALQQACPQALFPLQDPEAIASPLFTISLAQSLDIAVSNDSGVGHMCAAAGVPLISLFGPTSAEKLAPITPLGAIITAQSFGRSEMQDIPVSAVETKVDQILDQLSTPEKAA